MNLENRLQSLKTQHAALEQDLEQAQTRLSSDDAILAKLKKQKLALKDEIEKLSQIHSPAS